MAKSSISERGEADGGISPLARIAADIRSCRLCVERPQGAPLAHEPRPVLQVSDTARLLIASQAPGIRVHLTGLPYNDPSGDRLRQWMGVDRATFYDAGRIAIAPMGFCFPGWDAHKGDLPPRRECRARWHDALFAAMPRIETILVVGSYALDYHLARLGLKAPRREAMTAAVRRWRDFVGMTPMVIPLPHPSWRNNGWLKRNDWFESEVLPVVRNAVGRAISGLDSR